MLKKERYAFQKTMLAVAVSSLLFSPVIFADDDERDGDREYSYGDGGYSYGDRERDSDSDYRKKLVIMHTGDLHGDLRSHSNDREDSNGRLEGGLARAATVVKNIKREYGDKLVWGHTGDTISGSAIATYTQGKALIDIWDALSPDVFATGNWEYAYGIYRYQQLFGADGDIKPITDAEMSAMPFPPYDPSGEIYKGYNSRKAMKYDQNGEKRRWRTIAANAYYSGDNVGPGLTNDGTKAAGELLTDPYLIKTVNGIRIGFIGCTTNRGPQVVSSNITQGITFTNCMGDVKFPQNKPIKWATNNPNYADGNHPNRNIAKEHLDDGGFGTAAPQWGSTVGFQTVPEIVKFTTILRAPKGSDTAYINSATNQSWKGEGVDIVVLMSEAGIPENVWNAEKVVMPEGVRFPEIVLSSDTHEETKLPVAVTTPAGDKVILIEEGEDGNQVGLLEIDFKDGKIDTWEWKGVTIDSSIRQNSEIADLIEDAEAPFYSAAAGGEWTSGTEFVNPYNRYTLTVPLDRQMASTEIVLERNRFSHETPTAEKPLQMPAVIEGTLHDVYADAFRALTGADVGGIRGFRYTNTIKPGPVTVDDIYHSLSIGAMIAVGSIPASPEAEDEAGAGGNCVFDKNDLNKVKHQTNKCHRMAFPLNLHQEIELSGNSTQQTNIPGWGGGWFWNYSGISMDLDAYKGNFDKYGTKKNSRVSNVILSNGTDLTDRDDSGKLVKTSVTYASYYYDIDYNRINRNQVVPPGKCTDGKLTRDCVGNKVKVLAKSDKAYGASMLMVTPAQFAAKTAVIGETTFNIYPMDVVEAVGRYINEGAITVTDISSGAAVAVNRQGLNGAVTTANFGPTFPRIKLASDLPNGHDEFGFGVIQPMRGATTAKAADTPSDNGSF